MVEGGFPPHDAAQYASLSRSKTLTYLGAPTLTPPPPNSRSHLGPNVAIARSQRKHSTEYHARKGPAESRIVVSTKFGPMIVAETRPGPTVTNARTTNMSEHVNRNCTLALENPNGLPVPSLSSAPSARVISLCILGRARETPGRSV